jgi:hypothetical protein
VVIGRSPKAGTDEKTAYQSAKQWSHKETTARASKPAIDANEGQGRVTRREAMGRPFEEFTTFIGDSLSKVPESADFNLPGPLNSYLPITPVSRATSSVTCSGNEFAVNSGVD